MTGSEDRIRVFFMRSAKGARSGPDKAANQHLEVVSNGATNIDEPNHRVFPQIQPLDYSASAIGRDAVGAGRELRRVAPSTDPILGSYRRDPAGRQKVRRLAERIRRDLTGPAYLRHSHRLSRWLRAKLGLFAEQSDVLAGQILADAGSEPVLAKIVYRLSHPPRPAAANFQWRGG